MLDYNTMDISELNRTFTFSDKLLTPEIDKLLKSTYRRDIFVVCKDRRSARRLLDDTARCMYREIDKVDRMRYIIKIGYDVWHFISVDTLDINLRGRHRTEVVWDWDFEEALGIYKEKCK